MIKKKNFWLAPLFALLLIFGVSIQGALANQFQQIAGEAAIQLLDNNGTAITADSEVRYGDTLTIVVDGLKPNTDYNIRRGWTETSSGSAAAVSSPSLAPISVGDVATDANGHFSIKFTVGDIGWDDTVANRTLSVHEGAAADAPVLSTIPLPIKPKLVVSLLTATNDPSTVSNYEIAYGNAGSQTWADIGYTDAICKVGDTVGNAAAATQDFPYLIELHGYETAAPRTVSISMGGKPVPVWVDVNENDTIDAGELHADGKVTVGTNGALSTTHAYLAIPELPARSYELVATDADAGQNTHSFTVIPTVLNAGTGTATDNPAKDVLLEGNYLSADTGAVVNVSLIGMPFSRVNQNTIKFGGVATTHNTITTTVGDPYHIRTDGTMADALEAVAFLPLTVANSATLGIADLVIGSNTISNAGIISDSAASPQATLTVSPTTSNVADTVIVGLRNYTASSNITAAGLFTVGGINVIPFSTVLDANGNLLTRCTIPALANTWTSGVIDPQSIVATDAASTPTTPVTDSVNIDINPKVATSIASGNNGATITLTMSGFASGDTLSVDVDGVGHTTSAPIVASASGAATATFKIGDIDYNGSTPTGTTNGVDNYFAAGDHTITVKGTTLGDSASATFTVVTPTIDILKITSHLFSYAPTGNPYNGNVPVNYVSSPPTYIGIPGATVSLSDTDKHGMDFKASTPYLIMFDNGQDSLNLIKVGGFTSTSDGRLPLGVSFAVPHTALNGQHNILIAEDIDANGEYNKSVDSIVIGPNAPGLTLTVFANAQVSNYIRHVGDSVTVTMEGLNPSNETDSTQATVYQILVDKNANGPDSSDPVFPTDGFTPNIDGQAEVTFTIPEMPGGAINLYVIEKDTLNRAEPMTLANVIGTDYDVTPDGADEDAEIFVTPNISLNHYTGNAGDTVTVEGKAFVPGVQYAITFGLLNDVAVMQRGQVVTNFIADSNGLVPSGVSFTVPTANNSSYGVVVTPTPAANYVDVAQDSGVGLNSVMLAGDQPIFTVGGQAAVLGSASGAAGTTEIKVQFTGPLQGATANETANFVVTDTTNGTPIAVSSAVYDSATHAVSLTIADALVEGGAYSVTVSNLRDSFNNAISGTAAFSIAAPHAAPTGQNATEITGNDIATAPVNMGSVATGTGNQMQVAVNFPSYAAAVDIYVGIQTPDGTLYMLAPDGSLTTDLVPYATGVTDATTATIFDSFSVCNPFGAPAVPTGTWTTYSLVVPTNGGDISALNWATGDYDLQYYSFNVECN